jgi:hypothetical protein
MQIFFRKPFIEQLLFLSLLLQQVERNIEVHHSLPSLIVVKKPYFISSKNPFMKLPFVLKTSGESENPEETRDLC